MDQELKPHLTMISWKAIFAGLFVSGLVAFMLTALGVAIGGIALSDLEGVREFGWGAGIWSALTIIISLFVGSYVANRVSNFLSRSVGMVQGATIAALFFTITLLEGTMLVGAVGGAFMDTAKGMGNIPISGIAEKVANNPEVKNQIVEEFDRLGIAPQNIDNVVNGVAARLVAGDIQGAKRVVTSNSNVDPLVLDQRISSLNATVEQRVRAAAEDTAQAISMAGWIMFTMMVVGLGAAILGGVAASKANVRHSLEQDEILRVA